MEYTTMFVNKHDTITNQCQIYFGRTREKVVQL